MTLKTERKYDADSLKFIGWTKGDGTSTDGYHAYDYFAFDGTYLGADKHGIEPIAEFQYTEDDIREFIESHDDNDAMDRGDLLAMFQSVYERAPDDDEERDMWSWICNGVSHA